MTTATMKRVTIEPVAQRKSSLEQWTALLWTALQQKATETLNLDTGAEAKKMVIFMEKEKQQQ